MEHLVAIVPSQDAQHRDLAQAVAFRRLPEDPVSELDPEGVSYVAVYSPCARKDEKVTLRREKEIGRFSVCGPGTWHRTM